MELELDGAPRNASADASPSPFATRWRVGEIEIVAELDPNGHVVRLRAGHRDVGTLTPAASSHRFTIESGSGLRGGTQVEARIQRDPRTQALSLWVEGIEVRPFATPPASPRPPLRVEPLTPPSRGKVRLIAFATMLFLFLALFFVPKWLFDRPKDGDPAAPSEKAADDLAAKTARCLALADRNAEEAKAKIDTTDPAKRMYAEDAIADQRRLARFACKDHERACQRDPRSLPCLAGGK